ncbi:MAG: CoA pyrophosphatase [Solirubrobacterales bacterium]|nr:CoA pyrophosphatase [Solirubrobacterales bacterium]
MTDGLGAALLNPAEALTIDVPGRTDSAVLVALYRDRDGRLGTVLTRRRDELPRHAGEISFPGGRRDPGDPDLIATALREAEEEVGLAAAAVRVVGALQPTPTIATGYAIYPVVGVIEPGRTWTPSAEEVAEVLELGLDDLRAGAQRRTIVRRGRPLRTDTYVVGDTLVWGATARILADLLDRVPSG